LLLGSDLSLAQRSGTQTAEYAVGISHLEYIDIQRDQRPMVLDIYYPASINRSAKDLYVIPFAIGFKLYKEPPIAFEGKKYPLILLSHGRSGNRFDLAWLATSLASRGYIVGSMDHYFANSYYLSFEYVASKIWERPIDVSRHITHLLNHKRWQRYIDG
jgi:predicted dienelactone hydrolase